MEGLDHPVHFGEWIKLRRRALDLTQEELGRRAGCTVFALRKIESGERRPSKQLAELLATPLQIPSKDRSTFIKVARGELSVDRLNLVDPLPAPIPDLGIMNKKPDPSRGEDLPVPTNPLLGRIKELSSLEALLSNPECRLLTITGLGGVGKTHLAIEASVTCKAEFPGDRLTQALTQINPLISEPGGLYFNSCKPQGCPSLRSI